VTLWRGGGGQTPPWVSVILTLRTHKTRDYKQLCRASEILNIYIIIIGVFKVKSLLQLMCKNNTERTRRRSWSRRCYNADSWCCKWCSCSNPGRSCWYRSRNRTYCRLRRRRERRRSNCTLCKTHNTQSQSTAYPCYLSHSYSI